MERLCHMLSRHIGRERTRQPVQTGSRQGGGMLLPGILPAINYIAAV